MKNHMIDNTHGNYFMAPHMGFGIVMMGIGIAILFSGGLTGIGTGLILILAGGALCFTQYGIQLNFDQRTYKEYIRLYYLIRLGTWKKMADYRFITVESSNKGYTAISLTTRRLPIKECRYNVILLTGDHTNRLLIHSLKSKEKAVDYAGKLAGQTGLGLI